ncbi:hypothetical protein [Candidatus Symbiopectobacterium sp.]|uniref:hypothetical protein n=1 Tax=Candidatus Symbiopectobacterium sp. TaxID=2816440 RepID=UPI0025C2396F|nr:hypothetical protein [Candidatus Symbiopectobacterium sp.]
MLKVYIRLVSILTIAALVYGFMVPSLISMKDTIAAISGVALAFLTPPFLCAIYIGLSIGKEKK